MGERLKARYSQHGGYAVSSFKFIITRQDKSTVPVRNVQRVREKEESKPKSPDVKVIT